MWRNRRYTPYRTYGSYGYGSRVWGRRGVTMRKAWGSARASKMGIKQDNLNVTVQGYINFAYGTTNPPTSNVVCFHPYAGGVDPTTGVVLDGVNTTHGGAVNDRSFRLKCAQYDEVRLDSMKVYINPIVSASSTATPAMTVATFWDRKASPSECGISSEGDWEIVGRMPTPQEVFSNEGAVKTVTNMNSTRGIVRSCYANNGQEKTNYWDSTLAYNDELGQSPLTVITLDAWTKKSGCFCPALYVVSQLNMTTVFGQNFQCSYRVEYNFSFRNPKSEMNDFIKVEDPTYVVQDSRAIRTNLANRFLKTYQSEKRKAVSFIAGERSLASLKKEEQRSLPAATAAADPEPETKEDETEMKQ